jgi:hypothetical protein
MAALVLHKEILFFIFISRSRNVEDMVLALHYVLCVCVCVCVCVRASARAYMRTVHGRYNVHLTMLLARQTIQHCM